MERFTGIKNIIFDFGGVLIDLNKNRCLDHFKSLGINNIEHLISFTHSGGVFSELELGHITPNDFRERLKKESDTNLSDKQIDEAWISILESIPAYKLDLLLNLKKTYKVYMLSNTNIIHFHEAKRLNFEKNGFSLSDYFDFCYLSYELGMIKPHQDIFKYVIHHAKIKPEESLFIDDSDLNIATANQLGFQTYLAKQQEDFSNIF